LGVQKQKRGLDLLDSGIYHWALVFARINRTNRKSLWDYVYGLFTFLNGWDFDVLAVCMYAFISQQTFAFFSLSCPSFR